MKRGRVDIRCLREMIMRCHYPLREDGVERDSMNSKVPSCAGWDLAPAVSSKAEG